MLVALALSCSAPAPSPSVPTSPLEAHAEALRARLDSSFTVRVEAPWVVVGDEDPAMVRARAESTVRWSSDALQRQYFPDPPKRIQTIWMFADDASYRSNAKALWGDEPDTPYGYADHDDLVMNISTGGGTLIHEMVHPLLDANLDPVPPWFNEAFASLHEQCTERDGRIVGLLNWRLPGLQAAIAAGEVPTFEAFMGQSRHAFYERDPGTNYSQGRYLVYYLQEHGLLDAYYARLHSGEDDVDALKAVLGRSDLVAFQADWEAWVVALER